MDKRGRWIPAKEWKRFFVFLVFAIVLVIAGLWEMLHLSMDWHDRQFKEYFKTYGSIARLLLFGVLAYYALMMVKKKKWGDRWSFPKKMLNFLMKIARVWHTPLALVAIALIALHIVGAFLYGFKMDFTDISGLLAGLVLIGVPVAGVLRYRKLDRKWHMRLGLVFAALFLIHAYL